MSFGQQYAPPPPFPQEQRGGQGKQTNGLAIAGLVLAILGILGSWIPFVNILFAFFAFLGLIFGIIGWVQSGAKGAGRGMAIAAVILSVLVFVVTVGIDVAAAKWAGGKAKTIVDSQNVAAPVTGRIGQPVKDGEFTFVVKSVRCGLPASEGSLPSGSLKEFCAVDVSVKNHGTKAGTFQPMQVEGFVAGKRYQANSVANLKGSSGAISEKIDPGITTQVVVMIDIPAGQRLDTVEVHDSIFSEGTSVSVG